jgi:hypothetical protein
MGWKPELVMAAPAHATGFVGECPFRRQLRRLGHRDRAQGLLGLAVIAAIPPGPGTSWPRGQGALR